MKLTRYARLTGATRYIPLILMHLTVLVGCSDSDRADKKSNEPPFFEDEYTRIVAVSLRSIEKGLEFISCSKTDEEYQVLGIKYGGETYLMDENGEKWARSELKQVYGNKCPAGYTQQHEEFEQPGSASGSVFTYIATELSFLYSVESFERLLEEGKPYPSEIPKITIENINLTVEPALSSADQSIGANSSRVGQKFTVGAFSGEVPIDWRIFAETESDRLRQEYMAQSSAIYREYSGTLDNVDQVNLAAYHIPDSSGTFVIVTFTIPPQSDLVNLLRNQADEKAKFGIEQGYIKEYLGLVVLDNSQFSGFYVKFIGMNGEIQISAGLEHKALKNTLIQLTLLSPKDWDDGSAEDALTSILESVKL